MILKRFERFIQLNKNYIFYKDSFISYKPYQNNKNIITINNIINENILNNYHQIDNNHNYKYKYNEYEK